MRAILRFSVLATVALLAGLLTGTASAIPFACSGNTAINHMVIDSTQASACLGSGTGNISGNPATDDWLTAGGTAAGFGLVSKDDGDNPFNILTATTAKNKAGTSGTWSIDSSFWLSNTVGALGFKFGTGNNPDEWFIFELVQGVSSGSWDFINVFGKGGGLSHTNLYSTTPTSVPEPATLSLLGLGLVGLGFARRRKRSA